MADESPIAYQRREFPALTELFSGYLNEDWDTLGDTVEAVVDLFKTEQEPEFVEQARAEVGTLLDRFPKEDQLAQLCVDWLSIDATYKGTQTRRTWFLWLNRRLGMG